MAAHCSFVSLKREIGVDDWSTMAEDHNCCPRSYHALVRILRSDRSQLPAFFGFVDPIPNLEGHYVVRPTDTERVVAIGKDGSRHFPTMRWGLVPACSADIKTGLTLFNARAETILQKRIFAEPFTKGRRCLVPVDGFYEFTGPKGAKQPHMFQPRDHGVMAFGGVWESWRGPKYAPLEQPLLSYSIITTTPNSVVEPIHDRIPVVFADSHLWDRWLDPSALPEELIQLLAPVDDDLLETFPVTRDLLKTKVLDIDIGADLALVMLRRSRHVDMMRTSSTASPTPETHLTQQQIAMARIGKLAMLHHAA